MAMFGNFCCRRIKPKLLKIVRIVTETKLSHQFVSSLVENFVRGVDCTCICWAHSVVRDDRGITMRRFVDRHSARHLIDMRAMFYRITTFSAFRLLIDERRAFCRIPTNYYAPSLRNESFLGEMIYLCSINKTIGVY